MVSLDRHQQRCAQEATRDVIFLFQTRELQATGWLPEGYTYDDEEPGIYSTGEASGARFPVELAELYGQHGQAVAHEQWRTIGVWLDRAEAEQWGHSQRHNHGRQYTPFLARREARLWRVDGVPAEGQLARLLQLAGPQAPPIPACETTPSSQESPDA